MDKYAINNSNHGYEPFWTNDVSILFKGYNYYKIIPNSNMGMNEYLNTLTRAFIYLFIILLIFAPKKYLLIPIIAIIIIVAYYYSNTNYAVRENFISDSDGAHECGSNENCYINKKSARAITPLAALPIDVTPTETTFYDSTNCQLPTQNNPFMNVTIDQILDNPDRLPACDQEDRTINDKINYYFNKNVYRDVTDIYDANFSHRNFYTTPSTTIPNDQTTFARWLYDGPETCKENSANCLKYEDVRYARTNPAIDRLGF